MQSTEAHFSSEGLEDEPGILQESFPEVVELSTVKYFSIALQNAQRQTLVAEGRAQKVCAHSPRPRKIRQDNLKAQKS